MMISNHFPRYFLHHPIESSGFISVDVHEVPGKGELKEISCPVFQPSGPVWSGKSQPVTELTAEPQHYLICSSGFQPELCSNRRSAFSFFRFALLP